RVEHREHGLRVTRAAAADLFIGRVRRVAAGVADGGGVHPWRLPEHALGSPEAAHPDDQLLILIGIPPTPRRLQRRTEYSVLVGDGHFLRAPGQRTGRVDHLGLEAKSEHVHRVRGADYELRNSRVKTRWPASAS